MLYVFFTLLIPFFTLNFVVWYLVVEKEDEGLGYYLGFTGGAVDLAFGARRSVGCRRFATPEAFTGRDISIKTTGCEPEATSLLNESTCFAPKVRLETRGLVTQELRRRCHSRLSMLVRPVIGQEGTLSPVIARSESRIALQHLNEFVWLEAMGRNEGKLLVNVHSQFYWLSKVEKPESDGTSRSFMLRFASRNMIASRVGP